MTAVRNTRSAISEELARAHRQVLDALVEGDRVTLDQLVDEDCDVIGPKGFILGKAEWIGAHSERIYEQVLLEVEDSRVTMHEGLAVRCDLQRSECLFKGETIAGLFRVLSVWKRSSTGWRLVAIQYTSVAPEAAPDSDR